MQSMQSRPRSLVKRVILIGGIVSTATLILAACGGTDSQSQSGSEAGSSLGERLKALAVPPAWKPRVPGPEVINGITVPPEPSPSVNNATLAGVDSNANGVRDDVERVIARKVTTTAEFNTALVVAKAYQRLLSNTPVLQADADASMLEIDCFVYRSLTNPVRINSSEIRSATFNTSARIEDIRTKVLYLSPRVIDTKHECA